MIPRSTNRRYWCERAACRGLDMMLWTHSKPLSWYLRRPTDRSRIMLCTQCEVLDECATWVMGEPDDPCPFHIVAGMVPTERGRLRKQARRTG